MKESVDHFGQFLETELGDILDTESSIVTETNSLPSAFELDGVYGADSEWSHMPGFIDDIVDFRDIVVFGYSSDGSFFCFDYRTSAASPSVIWWDDTYWRKVANNFDDFLSLFKIGRASV